MANFQATEFNPWNPLCPTQRDLDRTNELAKKNPVVAGVLTAIFPLFGLIYLNRGVNFLKILGYVFVLSFAVGITVESEETAETMGNMISLGGTVALIVEQTGSVSQARKRSQDA